MKYEDLKLKFDIVEEENIYLKAIANSCSININEIMDSKKNVGINTEALNFDDK